MKIKKNPVENLNDAVNNSMSGDLNGISKIGCFPMIILVVIIFFIYLLVRFTGN
ncbi:hypothetical protein ACFVRR_17560 [Gottfriedia sp. NPDC057948]|uniref:hypothetical protein n=1 Tax=Gottfriedia sp. NPDC057948 TaxID=3346287 RepID=UPI0036DE3C7B